MKTLDDIQTLLTAMKDRGAEMKAFDGLLSEISTSLSDIVALLEKPKAEPGEKDESAALVKALIEGLSKLSIKAPAVNVTVSPTPVQVNVPKQDAPVVHVMQSDWKQLHVKVGKSAFDGTKEFTITKK